MTDLPNLSKRLTGIYELIPSCENLYDIGTDHAYIPIACLVAGVCEQAYALDIGKGPLKKAEENISKYGLEKVIFTAQADGFTGYKPGAGDCSVIAGMGGLEIIKILDRAGPVKGNLILQPQRSERELRNFLLEKSYFIKEERLVLEEGKFYCILQVSYDLGKKDSLTDLEIYAGKNLRERCLAARAGGEEPMLEYLDHMIDKTEKRILGDASLDVLLEELLALRNEGDGGHK